MLAELRKQKWINRKLRVRKKVSGTAERPRLSVQRSHLNLSVQVIDDLAERTLHAASTLSVRSSDSEKLKQWGNVEAAKRFGTRVAEELKQKHITKIVFDRNGRAYHGRVRAFAEALRENGIQF